eukprot:COSAG03_NODE_17_length_21787_cov_46.088436_16_plen_77_part_00
MVAPVAEFLKLVPLTASCDQLMPVLVKAIVTQLRATVYVPAEIVELAFANARLDAATTAPPGQNRARTRAPHRFAW